MVVAWFVVRTVAGADGRAYLMWVVAAGVLALVAPRSGLVVFVATSVFFEPDSLARTLRPRELVVLPLALGVVIQVAADRFRWRPGLAIWLALLLVLGTALGVVHTFRVFEQEFQWHAAQSWIGNMLAPVILLIAAAWTARNGNLRVLVVAVGVGVVAAIVCLIEYAAPGSISNGPLGVGRVLEGLRGAARRHDPVAERPVGAAHRADDGAAGGRPAGARRAAARVALVALVPVLLAQYLTFSRAPFIALYVFVVDRRLAVPALGGDRRARRRAGRRRPGAAGVSPTAGQQRRRRRSRPRDRSSLRATRTGSGPGAPLSGWWQDKPLIGQGYLAYKELAEVFGDPVLGSPHNEWLRIFAEEGVIVGLVGLAFLVATGVTLARVPGWLGTGILAGFLGYVIAASFNNPLLFVRVSAVAFTIVGVGLALAERARAPATDDARRRLAEPVEPAADPALD